VIELLRIPTELPSLVFLSPPSRDHPAIDRWVWECVEERCDLETGYSADEDELTWLIREALLHMRAHGPAIKVRWSRDPSDPGVLIVTKDRSAREFVRVLQENRHVKKIFVRPG
jgi:hypothetical protein